MIPGGALLAFPDLKFLTFPFGISMARVTPSWEFFSYSRPSPPHWFKVFATCHSFLSGVPFLNPSARDGILS